MRASERLGELKSELERGITIDRFVSLSNPKNVSLMEALVAYGCTNVGFDSNAEVNDDATMDELWSLSSIDTKEYADTAGITPVEAIAKLKQLRNLKMIYPDGGCMPQALTLVKAYVASKMKDLKGRDD